MKNEFWVVLIFLFLILAYLASQAALDNMNKMKQNLNETQEIIKDINSTKNDFENLEKVIDEIQLSITELNNLQKELPSTKEIVFYLENFHNYDIWLYDMKYNCVDYSSYLIEQLRLRNIFSCGGYIESETEAHMIVVVQTKEDILYIEATPEYQHILYPKITKGFDYCEYQGWDNEDDCVVRKFVNCYEGRVV